VGEAATAFTGLMARWDADARALSEALRAIGEAILGSGRTYQRRGRPTLRVVRDPARRWAEQGRENTMGESR
jgi:uncharacterized protein YukE